MDEKTPIFTDNKSHKIANGVYVSHYDYAQAESDITPPMEPDKVFKIECKETTFTVQLHEDKKS